MGQRWRELSSLSQSEDSVDSDGKSLVPKTANECPPGKTGTSGRGRSLERKAAPISNACHW